MIEFNATFIVAMLSFVVFIFVMNAIFYNPILSIIRKRENFINANYEDAKRFEQSADENNDVYKSKIMQTQDKCRHDIKLEVGAFQGDANDKLKAAKESFKDSVQKKKNLIAQDGKALESVLSDTVVKTLASSIVEKIIGNETEKSSQNCEPVNKVVD